MFSSIKNTQLNIVNTYDNTEFNYNIPLLHTLLTYRVCSNNKYFIVYNTLTRITDVNKEDNCYIYDTITGNLINIISLQNTIRKIDFGENDYFIILTATNDLKVYDIYFKNIIFELLNTEIYKFSLNNYNILAIVTSDNELKIYNINSKNLIFTTKIPTKCVVLKYINDNNFMIICENKEYVFYKFNIDMLQLILLSFNTIIESEYYKHIYCYIKYDKFISIFEDENCEDNLIVFDFNKDSVIKYKDKFIYKFDISKNNELIYDFSKGVKIYDLNTSSLISYKSTKIDLHFNHQLLGFVEQDEYILK